jgi:predicted transcriptional regulator YdeE
VAAEIMRWILVDWAHATAKRAGGWSRVAHDRRIPSQWQRFMPHVGNIPGQIDQVAFGVRWNGDEEGNFDYLCGIEVSDFSTVPAELAHLRIPAQKYAVFSHREHISTIRSAWVTIWNNWLPASGHELIDAPDFERDGPEFDTRTGTGGFEILVPIGKAAETIRSLGHAVSQAPAPLTDFSKGIATIEADRQSIGRQAFGRRRADPADHGRRDTQDQGCRKNPSSAFATIDDVCQLLRAARGEHALWSRPPGVAGGSTDSRQAGR